MSGKVEVLAIRTPDQQSTPRKNKWNKSPAMFVLKKEIVGDTFNLGKLSQEYTVIDT